MLRLIFFILVLLCLPFAGDLEAACSREVDAQMQNELHDKGFVYHGAEPRQQEELVDLIRESHELSLAQKREIKVYADSKATELYLVIASGASKKLMELLIVSQATCEVIRNYHLYIEE